MSKPYNKLKQAIASRKRPKNSPINWKRKYYKAITKTNDIIEMVEDAFSTVCLITQNKIPLFNNTYVASTIISKIISTWFVEYIDAFSILPEKVITISRTLNKEIAELTATYNKKLMMGNDEHKYFHIELDDDTYIIQICDIRNNTSDNFYLYCANDQFDKVKALLSDLFWKKYEKVITIKPEDHGKNYKNINSVNDPEATVCFKSLDKITGFYPKQYYEFFDYVNKFMKNNISRAIVLYGAPGTGKTVLSKLITQQMELKTLHINVSDFGSACTESILNFVEVFSPEAIVIDDFDRLKNTDNLLSLIENLHKKLKIIIVSVNDKNFAKDNLALIRPERFDKFIEVKTIDEKVAYQLLGEDNKEFFDKIKEYPAAYIKEAGTSIRVLGKENAEQIFQELDERVKAQDDKYNY